MFTSSARNIYPVPEAIERKDIEGAFDIESGYDSSLDLSKRKMVVQTGGACVECGEDHARATRLREMGHIAWTPADYEKRVKRTKDGLPLSLVEECEVARINARRKQGGLEETPPLLCETSGDYYFFIRQMVRSGDMLGFAGMVAAATNSGDAEGLARAITKVGEELSAKVDKTEQLKAEFLVKIYNAVTSHTRFHFYRRNPSFRYSIALARDIIRIVNNAATSMSEQLEEMESEKKVKVKEFRKKNGRIPDKKGGNFGKMDIVQLPMPNRSKAGFERRWTARDEGDIPTRFDRWSIDKRVFRAKKRTKGAALLVDVSGSMSWEQDDLARVLDEVPAATIAIYSGSGKRGQLVIVARKGRCASMRQAARHMLGGNIIDGPALEWLAEQPETTKLWMSDGGITGVGDGYANEEATAYANRVIRKGGIQQVRNAEEVMAVLTGKRPFTPSKEVKKPGWWA